MANHKSAIKRHKQSLKAYARNKAQRTRVKNVIKDVREAIEAKDLTQIQNTLKTAQSILGKATTKGAIHWKTAARKLSRLACAANAVKA